MLKQQHYTRKTDEHVKRSKIGPLLLMPFHFSDQKRILSYCLDLWLMMLMLYCVCVRVCVCVCVVGSVFRSSLLLFPWRPMETNQRPWLRTVLKPADREGRACLTHEEIAHVSIRIHTYQISMCNSVILSCSTSCHRALPVSPHRLAAGCC